MKILKDIFIMICCIFVGCIAALLGVITGLIRFVVMNPKKVIVIAFVYGGIIYLLLSFTSSIVESYQ